MWVLVTTGNTVVLYVCHCSNSTIVDLFKEAVFKINVGLSANSPGHTLRCCTPAMGRSEGAAMPQNRVRCAAIES